MSNAFKISRRYLVASDFDQTLSFHRSNLIDCAPSVTAPRLLLET